ncbi:MAG: helix-turn-helix domain-containing protein [Methylococcaceae bacterium]
MSTIEKSIKAEIIRLATKVAKAAIQPVKKPGIAVRKAVADLKKRVLVLERENRSLKADLSKIPHPAPVAADGAKARITGKGMRSLRKKLGLTQGDFGKLVGVTSQNVYQWERKDGALRVRDVTRASIVAIRDMGAREAKAILAGKVEKKGKAVKVVKKAKHK